MPATSRYRIARCNLPRPKIDLIYIDAGGGHRAAAAALDAVIREQQRPWETRLRNIQDLLYSVDVVRKLTGIPFPEVYNIMLRRGWTLGTAQLIPPMHLAIRIFHDAQVRALVIKWGALHAVRTGLGALATVASLWACLMRIA